MDVTLTKKTVLATGTFGGGSILSASYGGDFAGFAVLGGRDRQKVLGGSVLVRGRNVRYGEGGPTEVSFAEWPADHSRLHLNPGRYRFVLLTDGPAVVRVPALQGLTRNVRLAPRRAEPTIAAGRHDLNDLVPGPVAGSVTSVPFTLRERTFAIGSFHSSPGDYAPAYVALCARKQPTQPAPCNQPWIHDPGRQRTVGVTSFERGSSRGTGEYSFDYWEVIAGATVRDGVGFVAVFHNGG